MSVVTPTNTTTATTSDEENDPTRLLQQRPPHMDGSTAESHKTLRYSLARLQRSLSPRKVFSSSKLMDGNAASQGHNGQLQQRCSKSFRFFSSRKRLDTATTIESMMSLEDNGSGDGATNDPCNTNCLYWLQYACPSDVIPKILSHLEPQTLQNLSCTNKFWNDSISSEPVWKTICEDTHKWTKDDFLPTCSWKDYYKQNPCVPVDYPTIHAALAATATYDEIELERHGINVHTKSLRILLRPQKYILKEPIMVRAAQNVSVTIQTLPTLPSTTSTNGSRFTSKHPESATSGDANSSLSPRRRKAARVRNILNCRSASAVDPENTRRDDLVMTNHSASFLEPLARRPQPQARLVLKTRKHNQPIVAVRQGNLRLLNVALDHYSSGLDIWNGNSALQIQPPLDSQNGDRPLRVFPRPSVYCESVDIMSQSGRGICNIDGGYAQVCKSYIHDCAATGIYIGGSGTRALLDQVDVMENGFGNTLSRRGIARGHSGVYLEQGTAKITDSNISKNALTGVSSISPDNAFLFLLNSDLVLNATVPFEMPPSHTNSARRSSLHNNHMATDGKYRVRSGLVAANTSITSSTPIITSRNSTRAAEIIVDNGHQG